MGKKVLLLVLVVAAVGAGTYFWKFHSTEEPVPAAEAPPLAPEESAPQIVEGKPDLGHPLPGEFISEEQGFLEEEYGFSLMLPKGWKVVSWSEPAPPSTGQRLPPYKIRLEDPESGSLLDFAVYPFTEKSRIAVEEIFISRIDPPVPGLEVDIRIDEVNQQGEMQIRRAEMSTLDAQGTAGGMRAFYYLSQNKLYIFSLLASDQLIASGDPYLARILDEIRILG